MYITLKLWNPDDEKPNIANNQQQRTMRTSHYHSTQPNTLKGFETEEKTVN